MPTDSQTAGLADSATAVNAADAHKAVAQTLAAYGYEVIDFSFGDRVLGHRAEQINFKAVRLRQGAG